MIKCPEIRQKLFPFLDNELEVQENLDILTHLDLCPNCSEYFESEKQLEGLFKEKLKLNLDQEDLWHKVKRHLNASNRPAPWTVLIGKRLLLWGSAVAATLLIGIGALYYLVWPQKLNAETLVNNSVNIHRQLLDGSLPSEIPISVGHDLEKMRSYLSQRAGLYVCRHELTKLGYSPRGGCLAPCNNIPGHRMVTLSFYKGQSHLSHLIIKDPEIAFPVSSVRQIYVQGANHPYYFFVVKPYKVIILKNGQNLCLFVGSMSPDQVSDLVRLTAEEVLTT